MSVDASTFVWINSKRKNSALLMMLALADYANDAGECWPGLPALAKRVRTTVRNAQMILRKLEEDGDITIDMNDGCKTKTGKTNRYTINGFVEWFKEVKKISPLDSKGAKEKTPRKKQEVKNPSPQEVKNPSPDPSLEPSINTDVSNDTSTQTADAVTQPIEPETKREGVEPEPTIVQENSTPSKVPPKVSPDADKPAKASQPHILLIEAWHEAHPADIKPIGKPNIVRNVKTAKELVDAGVTVERVVAFMTDTYPGYIEWARSRGTSALMSLEHIKNNIRAWEAKKPNGSIKNGRYQPADDDYVIDPYFKSEEFLNGR